jgi:glycine dehydrogenase subunit 1
MATIYLAIYGREGLKELAAQNLAKATYASGEFARKGKILFAGSPRFNEFVVQTKDDPHAINKRLLARKTIGGFPLSWHYPELGNASLWCCTELNSKEQIDAAAQAVGQ